MARKGHVPLDAGGQRIGESCCLHAFLVGFSDASSLPTELDGPSVYSSKIYLPFLYLHI